jgi:hypothetical protein
MLAPIFNLRLKRREFFFFWNMTATEGCLPNQESRGRSLTEGADCIKLLTGERYKAGGKNSTWNESWSPSFPMP